jgi:hypothetical protein
MNGAGFYEDNKEFFQSCVVWQNIKAEGMRVVSLLDIWGAMQHVFQKEDMSLVDEQIHYKNMVPPDYEHMNHVLSCELLCVVLNEVLNIPAYSVKPGKLNAAFKKWGTKGQCQVCVVLGVVWC